MPEIPADSKAKRVFAFLDCASKLDAALAENPLSFDGIVILDQLLQQEGSCSKEIAQACGIPLASCTRRMDQLASLDLVTESVSRTDLRKNSFRLTTKGSAILFEIGKTAKFDVSEFACAYRNLRKAQTNPPLDFTEQRVTLSFYCENPQTVRSICAATGLAQPKASMALARLHANNLASPPSDATVSSSPDKRLRSWRLTQSGKSLAGALAGIVSDANR